MPMPQENGIRIVVERQLTIDIFRGVVRAALTMMMVVTVVMTTM